jgi:NADH dehydrogenase
MSVGGHSWFQHVERLYSSWRLGYNTQKDAKNVMLHARAQVLIVGGGFAGLEAAKTLDRYGISTLLVDRQNHHLFQPLLYQVATAALAAPSVAAPLRYTLRDFKHVQVIQDDVVELQGDINRVVFASGTEQRFDAILLATGSSTSYFGHPEWEQHAPGLKTLADAQRIRHAMVQGFELAERAASFGGSSSAIDSALTFVIIGGGPTGVELAGSLAEMAHQALPREFREVDTRRARIVLLEGSPRVLAAMPEHLSAQANVDLTDLGVDVRTQCRVRDIQQDLVVYTDAAGVEHRLEAKTIVWAAGVQASPLVQHVVKSNGLAAAPGGRVRVRSSLEVDGLQAVYAAGDCISMPEGSPMVPGMASAAKQMGRHAAENIARKLRSGGEAEGTPFVYRDQGALATIGRHKAVVHLKALDFSGYFAWLFWLFIHVFFLIGWRNRLVVLTDWAWAYWTKQRWARIVSKD